jgi:hypothetical protein
MKGWGFMARLEDGLKRVVIVAGSFGSGKSEFSLNLALSMATGEPVIDGEIAVVDLDIINPYFRSREAQNLLEQKGIKAIVPPSPDVFYSDLPIYGPGIENLLRQHNVRLILDVGGNEMGAVALGGLAEPIKAAEYDMLMVVNPYRPFTRDVPGICRMSEGIATSSRLSISALVSNPNLGPATTPEAVLKGHQVVEAAAQEMGLPVIGITVLDKLLNRWGGELEKSLHLPIMPMTIYLSPAWLQR